jgi:hypothetical protein
MNYLFTSNVRLDQVIHSVALVMLLLQRCVSSTRPDASAGLTASGAFTSLWKDGNTWYDTIVCATLFLCSMVSSIDQY